MRIKNLPSIESMDGSQDALVIEQTDGSEDKSRKVSPAQIKQYVLNDMDDVPTADSNNPVKSGGTKTYVDNAVSVVDTKLTNNCIINSAIQSPNLDTISDRQSIIYTNANTTNKPSGASWGIVITFNFDANTACQVYLSVVDSKMFCRSKSGGTWHSWLTAAS